jgi:deoxycytidine triphosphate deaminase
MSAGVLNQQDILSEFVNTNPPRIKSATKLALEPDPSAVDLPLGDKYYEMPASCRPRTTHRVSDLIRDHGGIARDLTKDTIFERGKVYLVKLGWGLELPTGVCARSTAKSSIGRLDTLVRLVADHQPEFDRIKEGENTDLYAEVVPITFSIKARPGMSLSQIRFIKGNEDLCTVPAEALRFENPPVLVGTDGKLAGFKLAEGDSNAVVLSLDLSPDPVLDFVGFVAKNDVAEPIDPSIRKTDDNDQRYDPKAFWDPVEPKKDTNTVQIERDKFYIFRSKERFRIPPHLAVDCQAYSESLGDIRIHYAGFAHPFFGYERENGTPLIFEVRGHSMDTILQDDDGLAKVYFRRMSRPAEPDDKQVYNEQELQLSACFKPWGA